MENWLKLTNPTSREVEYRYSYRKSGKSLSLKLAAFASTFLPIHDYERFGTAKDDYGVIGIDADEPFLAELLRVRYLPGAPAGSKKAVDYTMLTAFK